MSISRVIECLYGPRLNQSASLLKCARLLRGQNPREEVPKSIRVIIGAMQPRDPLSLEGSLPTIDLVIPCGEKDLPLLALVIEGARTSVRNPIGSIAVCVPDSLKLDVQERFPEVSVSGDEEILTPSLLQSVRDLVPRDRQGWAIQQLVKFRLVLESDTKACLVIDADTILLRPMTWLSKNCVQSLSISREFHRPYVEHSDAFWGGGLSEFPFSFVTHHQLMQKDIVEAMFVDTRRGFEDWLRCADWMQPSAISEYHSYGSWLIRYCPNRAVFARWGNASVSRDALPFLQSDTKEVLLALREKFPMAYSLSLHAWLPPFRG